MEPAELLNERYLELIKLNDLEATNVFIRCLVVLCGSLRVKGHYSLCLGSLGRVLFLVKGKSANPILAMRRSVSQQGCLQRCCALLTIAQHVVRFYLLVYRSRHPHGRLGRHVTIFLDGFSLLVKPESLLDKGVI